jgi:putative nucleotidyltransferase with HDIG domain
MKDAVLLVDDEQNVLNALRRVFSKIDAELIFADNADQALEILRSREVAVLVSDNYMPGTDGVELLSRARDLSPDSLKVLMTARADLKMAIAAINMGDVFRFVVKPWDNSAFVEIVEEGLSRYRLQRSLKEGDEATIRSLAQMIELKDPYTHGHCDRVSGYALTIADVLNVNEIFRKNLQYGCWLHDCGKVGTPEKILNLDGPLNLREYNEIKKHPILGAEVVRRARLPATVVNVVLYHHERFDGQGYPYGRRAGSNSR